MYYDVKIIRSRRKIAAIEINRDAEVILRLPLGATDEYASRLLDEKADSTRRRPFPSVRYASSPHRQSSCCLRESSISPGSSASAITG